MIVKDFPTNLVTYELALEKAFRTLTQNTLTDVPEVTNRDVEDAFFGQKSPEAFAASCLEKIKWLSQEELSENPSKPDKAEDTLTGELF